MTCSKGFIPRMKRGSGNVARPLGRDLRLHPDQGEQDIMATPHPARNTDIFSPGQPPAPYLASWHQAFAALDPTLSHPLEVLFDRGDNAPVIERVRIPTQPNPHAKRITAMYLEALVNNVLCTYGAKSVRFRPSDTDFDAELLETIRNSILQCDHVVSNQSMYFLRQLIEQLYGTPLSIGIDTGRDAAETRPARDTPAASAPPSRLWPEGSVLAVNIGQHLSSVALVRLGQGGYELEHLSRIPTWPQEESGDFPSLWERLLRTMRRVFDAASPDIGAVAVSIAATVARGKILSVPEFGLFARTAHEDAVGGNELIARSCREHFPGRPLTILNDAEAQALFAFAVCGGGRPDRGRHFLSLRLGACPAIRCLDSTGRPEAGLYEYSWLATRLNATRMQDGLFTTISAYLSHYGIGRIAWELGLLNKYDLEPSQAIAFFHENLLSDSPSHSRDAQKVYYVLGAHLAMLAFEVHRHRPLDTLAVHGSRTNRIDALAFEVIRNGFYAFATKEHLPLEDIGLCCLEDTSVVAGLTGAALTALRP